MILEKIIKKKIYIGYYHIKQFYEKNKRKQLVAKTLFINLEKRKLLYAFVSIKKHS